MRSRFESISFGFLLFALFSVCAGWLHAEEARVGDAPVLPALTAIDGSTITPHSLRGKVIVLAYFSSTCPFCMNEAPKLQKLHRENANRLTVIGVNIEHRDPDQRAKAVRWVEKYKLTHPVTTDFKSLEPILGKPKGIPATYIFDAQGRLSRVEIGEMLDEDFDDIARFARRN